MELKHYKQRLIQFLFCQDLKSLRKSHKKALFSTFFILVEIWRIWLFISHCDILIKTEINETKLKNEQMEIEPPVWLVLLNANANFSVWCFRFQCFGHPKKELKKQVKSSRKIPSPTSGKSGLFLVVRLPASLFSPTL